MTISPANIVGMHFRPPAKHIIANLPVGTILPLQPEPSNPYDEHAVMVLCPKSSLPTDEDFKENLFAFGHDFDSLPDLIHIGYIERTRAQDFTNVPTVTLIFSAAGKPMGLPEDFAPESN